MDNPRSQIKTIKRTNGCEVSYSCEQGGIITSLMLEGTEILYVDKETFENKGRSVRGGIPILFPNAGPIPPELEYTELNTLKQHGFARDTKWSLVKESNDSFIEMLRADDTTKKVYPYNFELSLTGELQKDGAFTLVQSIKNLEEIKELPVSSGLHPYFKVPNKEKKNIAFNFKGGHFIEQHIENWANGEYISIDNPLTSLEISIPSLGILVLDISKEYQKIWIWSEKGKDFICIEPVMGDVGGIITDPQKIKPGEILSATIRIQLREPV